jgi:cyclohexa-1,5-dienecarbonyl-CoA hydratase
MTEKIIHEYLHENQVVRITLNSPKGNVLDAAMMNELQTVFVGLKDQPQVKLIQFIGEGKHFSFGASVEEHTKENAQQMLKQFHQLFYTLADLSIPTLAMVSGQCLGGGCELALMCNLIFVDQSAKLGQPEISLGVFPPPASLILPMKIGQSIADDLLLTGRIISAEEAVKIGLANKVYDDKDAMISSVDEWTSSFILPKSASSLRFAVKAGRKSFNETLSRELKELEKMYTDELMETEDANEGINSFLERRKPEWKDK